MLGTCNLGFLDCDQSSGNGCEVDGTTDVNHCGACGNRCTAGSHQVVGCSGGSCRQPCAPGFAHCSMNPNDGCEVDTTTDVLHCGGCGNECTAPPHAMASCARGVCEVGGCSFGFADCNKVMTDGS